MFELMDAYRKSAVIKVLGVGGGGGNAVKHMASCGIEGVDFVVCNTDSQALEASPVPTKIQLGTELTEGLGAGSNPEMGKKAAEESIDSICGFGRWFNSMVFRGSTCRGPDRSRP